MVERKRGKNLENLNCFGGSRGFDEKNNEAGYIGVSKFMMENAEELYKETIE